MTLVRKATFDAGSQRRRAMLAKVHIAKKQLGLTEDDYRAVLLRVGGAASSADLDDRALDKVLREFASKGFTAKADGKIKPAMYPAAKKARALWISLHQLGAVRNPSEQALEAFARAQLGVVTWHWANQAHAYKLIEALKAMAERVGWDQGTEGVERHMVPTVLKRRLAILLNQKLKDAGLIPSGWTVSVTVERLCGLDLETASWLGWEIQQLERACKALADKLAEPARPIAAVELVR